MIHVFDVATHETTRLAAVLEAMGDTFDPDVILEQERSAHGLLYSGLDGSQRRVYDELVAADVLGAP